MVPARGPARQRVRRVPHADPPPIMPNWLAAKYSLPVRFDELGRSEYSKDSALDSHEWLPLQQVRGTRNRDRLSVARSGGGIDQDNPSGRNGHSHPVASFIGVASASATVALGRDGEHGGGDSELGMTADAGQQLALPLVGQVQLSQRHRRLPLPPLALAPVPMLLRHHQPAALQHPVHSRLLGASLRWLHAIRCAPTSDAHAATGRPAP